MTKIKRDTYYIDIDDFVTSNKDFKYKLTKPDTPGFSKFGNKIGWIKWNEDDSFNSLADGIEIDSSFILDPHSLSYTWMTTGVTEIVEQTDDYILFKTKNSLYKLEKL